ncbi:tyrosine-type recombinase/integrase [Desulfoscipio geothermicus]|uniref:Site-specific recombinase XerD n=1 Tax=Desulfoscipio geothermicus DSM 3669 TaxID=1121426 RepID=A0A1I6EM31_9FIRM|nr:tyrosine-type recombinase/integrase [Desulfoscipio geothermicus]SFR18611.1 Site-specific recombinase XerD [Desulfoscipio geothermicus DSM 3669]
MTTSKRIPIYTSVFADVIKGFVLEKQALGYAYHKQAIALKRFDDFCVKVGHSQDCLSKELAMQWAEKTLFESDDAHSRRIRLVRMLAKYLVRLGYKAYIYPDHLGRSQSQQYQPYLFTEIELARFFKQLDRCQPIDSSPNRHIILPLLFRILYGCGLRISEAIHLTVDDVNTTNGTLTIRNAKFNKDRLVPIAPSLNERCRTYMEVMHPDSQSIQIFFPSTHGGPYSEKRIYDYFRRFLWEAGISHGGRGKGPRLHDLRHVFAVHCLKRWVQNGTDLTVALPYLSTYLGHTGLKSSQHYLRLTAELYPDIVATMDERFGCLLPGDDQ